MDKKTVRSNIKKARDSMTSKEVCDKSRLITENILKILEKEESRYIFLYRSINNEVSTSLLWDCLKGTDKIISFPRVKGDEMEFYRVLKGESLKKGYMGIEEPCPVKENLIDTDDGIIIVPGVAFDINGNRTGYGKGYYDRYLSKHSNLIKIGAAFSLQVVDSIDADEFDIPLDYIVTENNIYRCR